MKALHNAGRNAAQTAELSAAEVRARAAQAISVVLHRRRSLRRTLPPLVDGLPPPSRRLLREMCFGALRHGWRLRALLRPLLHQKESALDPQVQALLLLGLHQLEHTRIPPHAAVHETVAACAVLKRNWAKALVNGVLRQYLRRREELHAALEEHERDGLPLWLAQSLQRQWGETQYRQIVQSWGSPPPLCLRVNRRRCTRTEYLQQLQEAGIPAQPCEAAPQAVQLGEWRELQALPGFTAGMCSVQDQTAQLAVPLLCARPGERILDACAAPGGKTGQLLEECPELRQLTALDSDPERLQQVRQNLDRLRLYEKDRVRLLCADAREVTDRPEADLFDRILLDAPCSATGVVRRRPDVLHLRCETDIDAGAKLQGELLDALWPLLKPGGTLLYVTCSLLAEENQQVVSSFAKRRADVKCAAMSVPAAVEHEYGCTVLPSPEGGDGLFFARLERRAS